MEIDPKELTSFINKAMNHTYAGDGKYELKPERKDFFELVYDEAPWNYRDSFTGWYRSGGQEVVRFNNIAIWFSGYGGGMVKGKEELTEQTFGFLKKALAFHEEGFESLRGPHNLKLNDWEYLYMQEGDVTDFYGNEEIKFKGEKVFWHRAIGGILKGK